MNYSALESAVRGRLNMGTNDPLVAQVPGYVNEALHYLETAAPNGWPWMRTAVTLSTTGGTSSYSFATLNALPNPAITIAKILSAKVLWPGAVYQELRLMSTIEATDLYPSTLTSTPEAYFVEGQTLYLYPTPDGVYTLPIRVIQTEADLVNSSDTPIMPTWFHTILVETATMLMYEALQDANMVNMAAQRVQAGIMRMRTFGNEYRDAPKVRVRDWV